MSCKHTLRSAGLGSSAGCLPAPGRLATAASLLPHLLPNQTNMLNWAPTHQTCPAQFAKLRHQGCSFLVAGRVDSNGSFKTLADLEMPSMLPKGVSGWLAGCKGN